MCQSQWPRGLTRRSVAARLLRLWVRIPPGHGCLSVVIVMCIVRQRSLRRADHSPRGVLPTVARRCVWSRNLVKEEAMAHWGTIAPKTNKQTKDIVLMARRWKFVLRARECISWLDEWLYFSRKTLSSRGISYRNSDSLSEVIHACSGLGTTFLCCELPRCISVTSFLAAAYLF